METFSTYNQAKEYAHCINQTRTNKSNPLVTVYGPNDNEGTVMTLAEAIENEFSYEWDA
jgi:hypothetical protein